MAPTQPDNPVETLRGPLERVLQEEFEQHVEHSKSQHLLDIQRNHLYWRGQHYAVPTLENGRIRYNSYGNVLSSSNLDNKEVQDYVLNYIYGEGLKLIGILGRIPNCTAVADSKSESAESRAKKADEINRGLWPHLNLEVAHIDLLHGHWINGTMFAYTRFVVNPDEYGYSEVPDYKTVTKELSPARFECFYCKNLSFEQEAVKPDGSAACPHCGAPLSQSDYRPAEFGEELVEGEPRRFPNGSVEMTLCSSLQVTTPYSIRELDDKTPWLVYQYEEHPSVLMAAYLELAENLARFKTNGGDAFGMTIEQQGRTARMVAGSYRNYAKNGWDSKQWLLTRAWLHPAMYYSVAEAKGGTAAIQAEVDALRKQYPSGMKLTYVNGRLIRVESEKLIDVWTACKPTAGETLYPQPLCAPYISMNDLINDTATIAVQTAQRGMSLNLYDPAMINPQLFRKNRAAVLDWIPATPEVGRDLRQAVFTTTPAKLDDSVMSVATMARQAGQEITGITAPLTGLDNREKTLGESEMNRNQALLPHNTQWTYIRRFWSQVIEKCIVQLARYTSGNLFFRSHTAMPAPQLQIDNIDDLLNGGWHVECDQAIPLTWGQRRAQWFKLIELGPPVMQMFGMDRPVNMRRMYEILGNEDLEVPGMALHEKVMADIQDLMNGQPIIDPMTGEEMPSIPPDEFEMDHLAWVTIAKEWFISGAGRSAYVKNRAGYDNVLARAKVELNIVNMLAAQNAPPPDAPQGGGGAPAKNDLSQQSPDALPGGLEPPVGNPEEMAGLALEGV